MMTPVSSSPVVFGPFHTPHAASTVTLQVQRAAVRCHQTAWTFLELGGSKRQRLWAEQAGEPAEAPSGDRLPPGTPQELDAAARRAIAALRQRDQEVRQHEQAHLLVAGPYAKGGPSYTYADWS